MRDLRRINKIPIKIPVVTADTDIPKHKVRLWPFLIIALLLTTTLFVYQWIKAWNDPNYCGRPALEWCHKAIQ